MFKKILTLMLALCLATGGLMPIALAAEEGEDSLLLIFEENFEEYEKDVTVSSTLMPNFFVCDANSIGDGIIHVQEATDGNLYLRSHVFTQIYSATPIVGAYELSLDIFVAQGTKQTGVFIRAPKTNAAYYEADYYPETSVGQAGLFLYTRNDKLGVNIKTYDASADKNAFLQNNTVEFPLPAGAMYPYTLRVVDANNEIQIYVNGTLMCRVTYADPGKTYAMHESTGKFYGSAKLFDAQGNEKGSYTDPLLSSDGSYVGWTTRVADMVVDNISVKAEAAYQTVLAIHQLPSKVTEKNLEDAKELSAAARELYDTLPEDKKTLVVNYGKLTKSETAIIELEATLTEPPTEAPTEPVTEPITEAPTEAPTDAPTEAPTDPATEAPTGEGSDRVEPEVRIIDDSLAVWILIAVMAVSVCAAAAVITKKVRE